MDILLISKYILLGLLQGFTEPLPISSSGHLEIAEHLLGLKIEGLSFAIIVNFASLFAVLLVYKESIWKLTKNSLGYIHTKSEHQRNDFVFALYLVIATIPTGILGMLFNDIISAKLSGIKIIGFTLLITAVALWMIRHLKGTKGDYDISLKDALLIGFAQCVALIPGISRSGATIVAALSLGLDQKTALKFSFFLYIPVSVGAGILGFSDFLNDPLIGELWVPYLFAFIAAFVLTYFALKWFMGVMEKGKLHYFSFYCLTVGLFVLIFLT